MTTTTLTTGSATDLRAGDVLVSVQSGPIGERVLDVQRVSIHGGLYVRVTLDAPCSPVMNLTAHRTVRFTR